MSHPCLGLRLGGADMPADVGLDADGGHRHLLAHGVFTVALLLALAVMVVWLLWW